MLSRYRTFSQWLTALTGTAVLIFAVSRSSPAASEISAKDNPLFWKQRLKITQQKYKDGKWGSFFAETLFFRMHLPQLESSSEQIDLIDTYMALEIIALSKHCQWKIIKAFSSRYVQTDEQRQNYPKSSKALSFVMVKKDLPRPEIDEPTQEFDLIDFFKQSRDQWPVQLRQLANLESPEGVLLKVESVCKQEE